MILKQEFKHDINTMTKLHQIKEEEYCSRIGEQARELDKIKGKLSSMVSLNQEVQEETNMQTAQAARFKKQVRMRLFRTKCWH